MFYLIKNIEKPFYIERNAEIRTPEQIKIDKDCTIKSRTIINGRSNKEQFGVILGENTYLKENCYFDAYSGFIHIDGFCAFGQNTIIHGGGGVKIGKHVITGANCYIISSNHIFNSTEFPVILQGDKRKGITIENNVWLGGSVIVLDGVTIGRNSIIGAGTVVTKDVPKNSLIYNKTNLTIKNIYKMKTIIEGNLVLPTQVTYGQVVIDGELIANVITEKKDFVKPDIVLNSGSYLSPGFIDIQINGAFGKEFKTDADAIEFTSSKIYEFGITSFCPTVTTSEFSKYKTHVYKLIENYTGKGGTKFIGLHFEGPALNSQKVGAQNASLLKTPKELELDLYLNPKVKMVTFSPELDGANEFIAELLKRKIKIGFGHSTISYDKVTEIFDEKNMLIVHLFNAMDGLSSREPGLVGAGMANENYYISVIPDGFHLHPKTLNIIWKSKPNKRKIICISDGSAVLGLETGTYQIGERTITKSETTATLPNGTLVGSILTLNNAAKNLMSFCNASLLEAINTVSLNPATYLGLENEIGQIKEGNKADLVVLNSDMNVEKTFINGGLIYER